MTIPLKVMTTFFILWSLTTLGQKDINWQTRLDSYPVDRTTEALLTEDGGYIIGGHIKDEMANALASADTDVWVVKLNGEGEVDWEKLVAARNKTALRRIFETPEEAKLVIKNSTTASKSDKNASPDDQKKTLFTIGQEEEIPTNKIQSRVVRKTQFDYKKRDDLNDPSFLDEEVTPESITAEDDLWMLKADPEFEILWKEDAGEGTQRTLSSIAITPAGNILAAGSSNSVDSNDPYPNRSGNNDFYVTNYSPEGKLLWSKYIGGAGDDKLEKVITTQDGGYLLGGTSDSRKGQSKTVKHLGGKDWWLVKIDDQGEILWQRSYGNFTDDKLTSLQELDNGDIIIGGTKSRIAKPKYTTTQNGGVTEDFSIIKINPVGLVKWQFELGGSGREYLSSALQKKDDAIMISGVSYSSDNLMGDKEEEASDIWIINYNIKELESFEKQLNQKDKRKKTIFKSSKKKKFNRLEYYDEGGNLLDTKYTYKLRRLSLKTETIPENTYYIRVVSGNTAAIIDWEASKKN